MAERLDSYDWPGNVRELRNAMERAAPVIARRFDPARNILPSRVRPIAPSASSAAAKEALANAEKLDEVEAQAILQVLRKHAFNRTATAKALGISRRALIYKLQACANSDTPWTPNPCPCSRDRFNCIDRAKPPSFFNF